MENIKIISDKGIEIEVNGLFYVFDSKYYFIYTTGEMDENQYVKLYVVKVGKEIQNTPTGPIDTGYMIGMEISDNEEWNKVQQSITKIVESKKNNIQISDVQYLPINMLVNLKIVSKNKFKLMRHIIEDDFKINFLPKSEIENDDIKIESTKELINESMFNNNDSFEASVSSNTDSVNNVVDTIDEGNAGDVIIDYRARFFEEQEKNQQLQEQIKILTEKLNDIKSIIG